MKTYTKEETNVKAQIDVTSKEQGAAINKALNNNPVTKAAVVISGVLEELTPEQRVRVIKFVQESLDGNTEQ